MSDNDTGGLEQALREEVAMLRAVVKELTEARDIALVEVGELREALAHYSNHPPPHPKP